MTASTMWIICSSYASERDRFRYQKEVGGSAWLLWICPLADGGNQLDPQPRVLLRRGVIGLHELLHDSDHALLDGGVL